MTVWTNGMGLLKREKTGPKLTKTTHRLRSSIPFDSGLLTCDRARQSRLRVK